MEKVYLMTNDGVEGVYDSLDKVKEAIKRRFYEWHSDLPEWDITEDEFGFEVEIWDLNTNYHLDGFSNVSSIFLAIRYQTEVYEISEEYYREHLQC